MSIKQSPNRSRSSLSTAAPWRTLDLFSGCGGLTEGFALAKSKTGAFQCVGAMDNWQAACDTFSYNHGIEATCAGVSRESVEKLLEKTGPVDIITGGPPCQGFSTSGKRSLDDPRNELVKVYLDTIELAKPRAFIMENVTGFTTFQDGQLMEETVAAARELGYNIFPGIVLASLVGVPQRRRRFIMVGLREGSFVFPGSSASKQRFSQGGLFGANPTSLIVDQGVQDGVEQWTFDDATNDLPSLNAGEEKNAYACPPINAFQAYVREGCEAPTDHIAVGHKDDFIEMMKYIPPGRSAMDADIRALMPVHLRPKSGFPNSYARLRGDSPSPTITRNFTTPSSANCIHPTQHRAMSIREGARCQSFRDQFTFSGNLGDKRLMIGNAVPPLLAKALGESLLVSLAQVSMLAAA